MGSSWVNVKSERQACRLEPQAGADLDVLRQNFFLLQEANIAKCEEQTHLSNIVKILGGFFAKNDHEGLNLMMDIYHDNQKRKELRERYSSQRVNFEHFDASIAEAKESKKASLAAKRDKAKAALGARYDLRDFDDAVITAGSVPMDVMATVVDRYIAAKAGKKA